MTDPELRLLHLGLRVDGDLDITLEQLRRCSEEQLEEFAGWLDAVLVFWRERHGDLGFDFPPDPEWVADMGVTRDVTRRTPSAPPDLRGR